MAVVGQGKLGRLMFCIDLIFQFSLPICRQRIQQLVCNGLLLLTGRATEGEQVGKCYLRLAVISGLGADSIGELPRPLVDLAIVEHVQRLGRGN